MNNGTDTLPARKALFSRLLDSMEGIEGDVIECGVGWGHSLRALSELTSRSVYGFDSFEGFPVWTDADLPGVVWEKLPRYEHATMSNALEILGEWAWKPMLVKGLLGDTLPKYRGVAVLVNVDVDLYESYRAALENLWPRLAVGGAMVFDEYHKAKRWPGARRAVDEYLESLPVDSYELVKDSRWYARKIS